MNVIRIILIISLCLIANNAKSNSSFSYYHYNKNIQISVFGDWGAPANYIRGQILMQMLTDFNKLYHNDSLYICVNINPEESVTTKYNVNIDSIDFMQMKPDKQYGYVRDENKPNKKQKSISLRVYDANFNLQECINIIDYAAIHEKKISELYRKIDFFGITKQKKKDSAWTAATQYMLTYSRHLDLVISKKYYAYSSYLGRDGILLDYYYRNDKYTIFDLVKKKRAEFKSLDQDEIYCDTIGTPILQCETLYEITGDTAKGYLIFTSFDSFYYYSKNKILIGPYKLPILRKTWIYREPIQDVKLYNDSVLTMSVAIFRSPYTVVLNIAKKDVNVDSSSIKEDVWDVIYAERALLQMEKKMLYRFAISVSEQKTRNKNIAILITIVTLANICLAYYAKKKR